MTSKKRGFDEDPEDNFPARKPSRQPISKKLVVDTYDEDDTLVVARPSRGGRKPIGTANESRTSTRSTRQATSKACGMYLELGSDYDEDEGTVDSPDTSDEGDNIIVADQAPFPNREKGYVDREIARLQAIIPDHQDLYLASVSHDLDFQDIPRLESTLIHSYCPKEGRVWQSGLLHWLRSASALPIIKLWYEECMADEEMFFALKSFMPLKECPWKEQLARVTALTKLPDSGRAHDVPRVVLLCAIYTRKIFLCNQQRLLQNGTNSGDYIWKHVIDIPCAVLFAVYHEQMLASPGRKTFFSVLLDSPLALPMHSTTREIMEKSFPIPHAYPNPDYETIFFTVRKHLKPTSDLPPPEPANAVNHHVHYHHNPFSDKEQLLFWIAYKDVTDTSRAFGLDPSHIAELLPGRHVQEIQAFYKLNAGNLGLEPERRVIVAVSGGTHDATNNTPDTEHAPTEPAPQHARTHTPAITAASSARAFAALHPYIPPARPAPPPPSQRETRHPALRAQHAIVDAALKARNEAEQALTARCADLEDARAGAGEAGDDALAVQMAWYEREEAGKVLREAREELAAARQEMVRLKAAVDEEQGEGEDRDGEGMVCEDQDEIGDGGVRHDTP